MRIVVTDLTRFSNKEILCLAGVTEDGMECIRPLKTTSPGYLTYDQCKNLNVLPGTILEGTFTTPQNISSPHTEDRNFTNLKKVGVASSDEFRAVLESSSTTSIRNGFGITSPVTDKVFKTPPARSIITLKIDPTNFRIVISKEKIKAHLTDGDGVNLSFLSITDLGFFDNVGHAEYPKISTNDITKFIHNQDELYIRLGLSRWYESPQKVAGYWMQVNGIYTFPNYNHVVRSYK